MEKPSKYFLIHRVTKKITPFVGYTSAPLKHDLFRWVRVSPTEGEWMQVYDAYIDTRYRAKIRLYNYLTYKKKVMAPPKYYPYAGTEVGKTLPILNF